jgi:hypothetical protein
MADPAKAGVSCFSNRLDFWIPAFAGMTVVVDSIFLRM